jgi:protein phosphatase
MVFRKFFQKKGQPRPAVRPTKQDGPGKRMQVGWNTDVGRQRQHNEDAILILQATQDGDAPLPAFGLFVLADGMGGHQSGEVASALAARIAARHVVQKVYLSTLDQQEHSAGQPALKEVLVEAVSMANSTVAATTPGGGTTLICALVMGSQAYIANVGDSRVYLVSPDKMEQVTRDHSLVDRLVEMGQLTAAEAANHPQKNVLYRAVGQGGALEVDTFVRSVAPGQRLLLCSDGLWGLVSDAEMLRIIAESPSSQASCDALVAAANQAGGRDNISVILAEPLAEA